MRYSPSSRVTRGSSTPNSSYAARGPSRAGTRKGSGSAVKWNPSGLRARPMMDRPVRRCERNSMMYSSTMLHDRRVVNGLYRVGDVGLGENRVVSVPSDYVRFHVCLFASSSKIVW